MIQKGNIRIVDIAEMAGVSVGTVDRILHNRGRVSAEKREKVEKVLKEINYEPNLVARLLATKHEYTLAAIIPSFEEGDYWHSVSKGIDRATNELKKFNINVEYLYFDQYDEQSFPKTVEAVKNQDFSGAIIATLFGEYVIELSKELDRNEIPYIYIDADIPNQNNLAYFGADSFTSGAIAAKLMLNEIGKDADIIIAHTKGRNQEISTQIQNREIGFMDYLNNNNFRGNIRHLEINTKASKQNLLDLENMLKETNNLIGGIIFNSRIYELSNLLKKINPDHRNKVRLIGYDAIRNNTSAIKSQLISFIIAQHSESQGYDSVKCLSNFLLFKQQPSKTNYMPIDILIKENIDYYINYKL